jgi:hypothetical protein
MEVGLAGRNRTELVWAWVSEWIELMAWGWVELMKKLVPAWQWVESVWNPRQELLPGE